MRRAFVSVIFVLAASIAPALAVDPPYEPEMEHLAQALGSLYFLNPLCNATATDWRAQMADLITKDEPDPDRQGRLYGAFNAGYTAYSRLYRTCTPSAQDALARLLVDAESTARDINQHYSE
jgi:uncharacterized protein (TIGR02301 family)